MSDAKNKSEKMPMTVLGKSQLEQELKKLMHEERPNVIKAIEEARAHGDISENAEYDAAKEKQALIEGRIAEIQTKLALAEVIDISTIKSDRIVFGATVTVMDLDTDEESQYQIVGVDEANVKLGKVSILSPLARALIGKKTGETIVVQSPKGDKEFEIKNFKFN
ncbi:MAG: transcription elongation factor GreA [Bdellovibrionaceae bacterium]|nr:transcription elongation factor GreA [Pseudobdellovibrionaceae bacterium]NUM57582.1 transcription elongation factor GreA [Pseudobdellovibrionaceae bacterium]